MILRLALVLAALAAALAPLPASWVESAYSERAYLAFERVVTPLANAFPFALFDALIVGGLAWCVLLGADAARRARREGLLRAATMLGARLATLAAVVYLVFLATWGLNYRRVPLADRLDYSRERVTVRASCDLARRAAVRANELDQVRASLRRSDWHGVAPLLARSFDKVQRQLAPVEPAAGGRPKPTLLGPYFERSGVDGMTDPFLLETLVNRSLLPFERPFVTAHEWAHLAGYADESEASFVGWLVCLQGPPAAQYSGYLALLWQVLPALPPAERAAVVRALHPGVRLDLEAGAERASHAMPALRQASRRIYDRYLKANRVEKGVESYDAALELILGTRFSAGWVPVARTR